MAEGLEVSMMFAGTGIGDALDDPVLASEVIGLIIDRAKLEDKSRGVMRWTLFGKQYDVTVEEYESLGEPTLRLKFGKPSQKRRRATR